MTTRSAARLRPRALATATAVALALFAIAWLAGSGHRHPVAVYRLRALYSCVDEQLTVSGRISSPNITLRATSLRIADGVGEVEVVGSWWLLTEIPPVWEFTVSTQITRADRPSRVTTRPPARAEIAIVALDPSCDAE